MTPVSVPSAQATRTLALPALSDCHARIEAWLTSPYVPPADKAEILALLDQGEGSVEELRDRFYRELEFGTGGLRGITGAGNNRINAPVLRRCTQGLANFILKNGPDAARRGVAIAYDSRVRSREFALEAACVLGANGIRTFVFDEVQTTPCLSFTVRALGCISGLCLTASHNPPQYHGYKVYWEDGAQIIPPQDEGILAEVFALAGWDQAKTMDEKDARSKGLLNGVPEKVVDAYFEALDGLRIHDASTATRDVGIAYTPLHGTGAKPTRRALARWGFQRLHVVAEQEEPDGRFPTVKKPNPEEPAALARVVALAAEKNCDLAVATDPDSDRLALVVKDPAAARGLFASQAMGDYVLLNGNQTGALLIDHILTGFSAKGRLLPTHKIVKTIVTSELLRRICTAHGVEMFDTLTGFKWIAGLVRSWEKAGMGTHRYLFGTEESFGYMPGDYMRDKDGIGALCQAVEMVAHLKTGGKTAPSRLLEIFSEHGAYQEDLINFDLFGEAGAQRIVRIMDAVRAAPPSALAGSAVVAVRDYKLSLVKERQENSSQFAVSKGEVITLPKSDVLQFELADGSRISMRPSGTEPKLKIYVSVRTHTEKGGAAADFQESQRRVATLRTELTVMIEAVP